MRLFISIIGMFTLVACGDSNDNGSASPANMVTPPSGATATGTQLDPDTAPAVAVDRFSDGFAHLFARSKNASLPAANAPIDFDQGPFITHGLGPQGQKITYYNFDVLPTTPAPIYVLFKQGESSPVAGQLNIVDAVPGDAGYNDFWNVVKVTVPATYVANTATSIDDLVAAGYAKETTGMLVNCPVVPAGSTAKLRYKSEPAGLMRGWYKHKVVSYFSFSERELTTDAGGKVPLSDIYVTFNVNPDMANAASGPPSGFRTEDGTMQTHNVTQTVPESPAYSPLWDVNAYDNAAFATVSSFASASAATSVGMSLATVNCPVVAHE